MLCHWQEAVMVLVAMSVCTVHVQSATVPIACGNTFVTHSITSSGSYVYLCDNSTTADRIAINSTLSGAPLTVELTAVGWFHQITVVGAFPLFLRIRVVNATTGGETLVLLAGAVETADVFFTNVTGASSVGTGLIDINPAVFSSLASVNVTLHSVAMLDTAAATCGVCVNAGKLWRLGLVFSNVTAWIPSGSQLVSIGAHADIVGVVVDHSNVTLRGGSGVLLQPASGTSAISRFGAVHVGGSLIVSASGVWVNIRNAAVNVSYTMWNVTVQVDGGVVFAASTSAQVHVLNLTHVGNVVVLTSSGHWANLLSSHAVAFLSVVQDCFVGVYGKSVWLQGVLLVDSQETIVSSKVFVNDTYSYWFSISGSVSRSTFRIQGGSVVVLGQGSQTYFITCPQFSENSVLVHQSTIVGDNASVVYHATNSELSRYNSFQFADAQVSLLVVALIRGVSHTLMEILRCNVTLDRSTIVSAVPVNSVTVHFRYGTLSCFMSSILSASDVNVPAGLYTFNTSLLVDHAHVVMKRRSSCSISFLGTNTTNATLRNSTLYVDDSSTLLIVLFGDLVTANVIIDEGSSLTFNDSAVCTAVSFLNVSLSFLESKFTSHGSTAFATVTEAGVVLDVTTLTNVSVVVRRSTMELMPSASSPAMKAGGCFGFLQARTSLGTTLRSEGGSAWTTVGCAAIVLCDTDLSPYASFSGNVSLEGNDAVTTAFGPSASLVRLGSCVAASTSLTLALTQGTPFAPVRGGSAVIFVPLSRALQRIVGVRTATLILRDVGLLLNASLGGPTPGGWTAEPGWLVTAQACDSPTKPDSVRIEIGNVSVSNPASGSDTPRPRAVYGNVSLKVITFFPTKPVSRSDAQFAGTLSAGCANATSAPSPPSTATNNSSSLPVVAAVTPRVVSAVSVGVAVAVSLLSIGGPTVCMLHSAGASARLVSSFCSASEFGSSNGNGSSSGSMITDVVANNAASVSPSPPFSSDVFSNPLQIHFAVVHTTPSGGREPSGNDNSVDDSAFAAGTVVGNVALSVALGVLAAVVVCGAQSWNKLGCSCVSSRGGLAVAAFMVRLVAADALCRFERICADRTRCLSLCFVGIGLLLQPTVAAGVSLVGSGTSTSGSIGLGLGVASLLVIAALTIGVALPLCRSFPLVRAAQRRTLAAGRRASVSLTVRVLSFLFDEERGGWRHPQRERSHAITDLRLAPAYMEGLQSFADPYRSGCHFFCLVEVVGFSIGSGVAVGAAQVAGTCTSATISAAIQLAMTLGFVLVIVVVRPHAKGMDFVVAVVVSVLSAVSLTLSLARNDDAANLVTLITSIVAIVLAVPAVGARVFADKGGHGASAAGTTMASRGDPAAENRGLWRRGRRNPEGALDGGGTDSSSPRQLMALRSRSLTSHDGLRHLIETICRVKQCGDQQQGASPLAELTTEFFCRASGSPVRAGGVSATSLHSVPRPHEHAH